MFLKISIITLILIVSISDAGRGRKGNPGYGRSRRGRAQQKLAPEIKMNDGCGIPAIGFGTWQLGNDSQVAQAIKDAIDVGYRHIDTASIYKTEKGIGVAINQAIASNRVKRDDFFITSKVWNNMQSRPSVVKSLKKSLEDLNLKYLDLFLIHYPTGFKEGNELYPKYENGSIIPRKWEKDSYLETWKGMEDARKLGLTKSIGVSNFNINQMRRLLRSAEIKPVVNQVENHPFLNQQKLLDFCKRNDVVLESYAPIRRADPELLNDPLLKEIAAKHNKSTAQVAIRWQIQRGNVVIAKTSKKSRMMENMDVFDFNISNADMKKILGMKQTKKYYDIPGLETHPDYPFDSE